MFLTLFGLFTERGCNTLGGVAPASFFYFYVFSGSLGKLDGFFGVVVSTSLSTTLGLTVRITAGLCARIRAELGLTTLDSAFFFLA